MKTGICSPQTGNSKSFPCFGSECRSFRKGGARSQLARAPSEPRTFPALFCGCRSGAHLQETVISTLVAGMFPVIGSKSYIDDMSSSLSRTSPSISSMAGDRVGSGVIREADSLAPTERVESLATPWTKSETKRPPVRPGEAATSEMLKLERMGE